MTFQELRAKLSELNVEDILAVFNPGLFIPYDPVYPDKPRMKKIDLILTTLYVFNNEQNRVKVYSSRDMDIISKDTLIIYVANDLSAAGIESVLSRESYPFSLKTDIFSIDDESDYASSILNLNVAEDENDQQKNLYYSNSGIVVPIAFNAKTVNLLTIDEFKGTVLPHNSNAGYHQTLTKETPEEVIIQFDPLQAVNSVPEEALYLTLYQTNREVSRKIHSYVENLSKPYLFNIHNSNDFYWLCRYSIFALEQKNEKLTLISCDREGAYVHFRVVVTKEQNPLKMRGMGAQLDAHYKEELDYEKESNKYSIETLGLPEEFQSNALTLSTELDHNVLQIKALHTSTIYKAILKLFFKALPIQTIGESFI